MILRKRISTLVLVSVLALFTSCNAIKTAIFDQYSYQQAISLKIESNELLENATQPFANHEEDASELLKEVAKMVEYEKNKENNNITYRMWELMGDEDKNLLAGLINRWETQGQLSEVFVQQATPQVQEAFDLIIKYESKKDKESKSSLLDFLTNN